MESHFSWERDRPTTSIADSNQLRYEKLSRFPDRNHNSAEDLSIIGSQCKLYYDNEKAHRFNSEEDLIAWGDKKIDRYDARVLLDGPSALNLTKGVPFTLEENKEENELNLERYADLKYFDENEEDETSSQNQAKQIYSCIPYQYDNQAPKICNDSSKSLNDFNDFFELPPNLNIPSNVAIPKSKKLNCVIEKTALFVAKQGPQMEILLKMKQSNNSNFHFLSHDSELNDYYNSLLNEIKSGRYTPRVSNAEPKSESDDSDEDYLHPSLLMSKKADGPILKNVVIQNSTESKYSQLVKNLKDKFADDIADYGATKEESDKPPSLPKTQNRNEISSLIPKPPDIVEKIITKLAEYVAQKGQKFEESIKSMNDEKFDFLNKGHKYHPYYVKQKIYFMKVYKKDTQLEETPEKIPSKPVAFSIVKTIKEPPKKLLIPSWHNSNEEKSSSIDKCMKDPELNQSINSTNLQQIRRQKLSLFYKKHPKSDDLFEMYGPQKQPKNIELSPTTKAITNFDGLPSLSSSPTIQSVDSPVISLKHENQSRIISNSPPMSYKYSDNDDKDSPNKIRRKDLKKKKYKHHERSSHKSSKHKHHHQRDSHSSPRRSKKESKHRHRHKSRSRSKSTTL